MRKIRYVKNLEIDEFEGQDIMCPEYDYIEVEDSYVKKYRSYLYALLGLKLSQIHVIEYLVDVMDENNSIFTNKVTRDRIINFYKEVSNGEIDYSDITIKSAIRGLTDKKLLIKLQRGAYKVNPYYFFKGSEAKRDNLIRIILQIENGTNDKLIIENV